MDPTATPGDVLAGNDDVIHRERERAVGAARFRDVEKRVREGLEWGVGGVVTNGSGAVLLVHHGEHWTIPGGGVDPGETFAEALQREVTEEAGIRVRVDELRAVTEQTLVHGDRAVSFNFATYTATPTTTDLTDDPGVEDEGIETVRWCESLPDETIDREFVSSIR